MQKLITKNVSIAGPSSQHLYGTDPNHPCYIQMVTQLIDFIAYRPYRIDKMYITMGTGLDMMMALAVINFNAAYKQNVKLIACISDTGHMDSFSPGEKRIHDYILSNLPEEQILLFEEKRYPNRDILEKRNQLMIYCADELLSFWDYEKYTSETYKTMQLAKANNIPVFNVHPKLMDERGYWFNPGMVVNI